MNKFFIKSMGCKTNQFEGQIVAQKLKENGFEQVFSENNADYYILNSCSVTHKSDNEAMYLIRHAKSLGLKTVLTGCIAQTEKENLLKESFIDFVFGNEDKFNMGELLQNNEKYSVKDLMKEEKFCEITLDDTSKTRVSLKIQDGCDNRCSYCIIPYARGKSRSADEQFIINEINRYSLMGYKEIVLTGIHIGLWGKDFNKELLDLLISIEKNTSIQRYRLGSLNPLEITPKLLEYLKSSEKFCPHFHLSLQSACDKTLKNMNRKYTVNSYIEQIEEISQLFKNPFLGCDIIAGFAGETEEDFEITKTNLENSKLSKIHVFPYSVRKGTIAEKMEGHLPDSIKNQRADIIKEISERKYTEFLQSNLNTSHSVLIEKRPDKKTGLYKGITENYIPVLLEEGQFNTIVNAKLTEIQGTTIKGRVL